MDVADVKRMLDEITQEVNKGDDEGAHSLQDEMYEAVLKAISEMMDPGSTSARNLAAAALQVQGFDFARWCA